MASIGKSATGGYKVRWRVLGKEKSKNFDTFAQADAYRVQIENDLITGRAVVNSRVTVAEWVETWQPNRQGLRATTRARNESLMKNHILPSLGKAQIADLSPVAVQSFVAELSKKKSSATKKHLAAATIRETYQELDKCLTAAVHARLLRENPCQGISLPKSETTEVMFLTHKQVKALAEAIDDRYTALIYLLAYSGIRIGEACALQPQDIEHGIVKVTKSVSEVKGQMITSSPKTSAGRRNVPLPTFVADELIRHQAKYPGPFIFTTRDGAQVRSNMLRQRAYKTATEKAGLHGLRIHDLRHTAVSIWIADGVDLLRIKKWTGHTSATFTLDRYGHLFEDDNDAILLKLNAGISAHHGASVKDESIAG